MIVGALAPFLLLALQAPADGSGPRRIDVKAIEWIVPEAAVVLGETQSVSVVLKATRVDGAPLDVADPVLWASTGTLSAPQRTSPGEWTTTFTPPPERFPHVAILSAQVETTQGPAVGFVSVPLWGKGRLEVKTKPKSSVVVYLGNKSYGPAEAGKTGVATVDIIAPPGPERAVAESTDPAGNQSSKPVPLGVPSFSRLALMPIDDVAAADGTGVAQLLLFIVDKKGAPLFDAADIVASADIGSFDGDPVGLAPGVFRLRFKPGETQTDKATVTVAMEGSKASTATADIRLLSGRPVLAEILLDRTELSADDDGQVVVETRWFDKAGNPSPASAARISVDVGRLDTPTSLEREGRSWTWHLPADLPKPKATLTARATTGEVLAEVEVVLKAGKIATIELLPVEAVVADGKTAVDVAVRATDRAGNPVSPGDLVVVSDAGKIVGLTVVEGTLVGRFMPDEVDHERLAKITASFGEFSVTQKVRLRPAPRPLLTLALGARADWNAGLTFGLGADMSALLRLPGLLNETLHVGLNLGFAPAVPLPTQTPNGVGLWRFHFAFPVLVEGAWRPLVYENVTLHLGAAVGAVVGDLTLWNPAGGLHAQRSVYVALGGQGVVGVAYRLGPGELEAMARVGVFIPLGGRSLWTPTATTFVFGYRFHL